MVPTWQEEGRAEATWVADHQGPLSPTEDAEESVEEGLCPSPGGGEEGCSFRWRVSTSHSLRGMLRASQGNTEQSPVLWHAEPF